MADPRRADDVAAFGQYGVKRWNEASQTVIGRAAVGAGHFSVADPRHDGPAKFSNVYRVVEWNRHASAVTSSRDVAIADPRQKEGMFHNAYRLVPWDGASQAITGQDASSNGAMCVADPRPTSAHEGRRKYKVGQWDGEAEPSSALPPRVMVRSRSPTPGQTCTGRRATTGLTQDTTGLCPGLVAPAAVSSSAGYDNGRWSVADPRPARAGRE